MAEYIRSIKVHVEIDTNKETYTLDIENAEIPEIQRQIDEFISGRTA